MKVFLYRHSEDEEQGVGNGLNMTIVFGILTATESHLNGKKEKAREIGPLKLISN